MITPASASPDVRAAILDLYAKLDQLRGSPNVDLHQRRMINAGDSIDSSDYVTRRETDSSVRQLQRSIDELKKAFDSPFSFAGDVLITGRLTVGGFVHQTGAQTTITSTALAQLSLRYDATNFLTITVGSAGLAAFASNGTTAHITFTPAGTNNMYVTKPFCVSPSGVITVSANIVSQKTTEQLRLAYDATHYLSCTTSSAGQHTFATVGTAGSAHIVLTAEGTSYAYSTRPFGVMATPATVSAQLVSRALTEQFRLEYDATNYGSFTVTSAGVIGITATATTETVTITSATATNQLRLAYDGSNYVNVAVNSAGSLDVSNHTGSNAGMSFTSAGTGVFYFVTGDMGIGVSLGSVSAKLHVIKTTEQFRVGYDDTHYCQFTVDSAGNTTINLIGTTPGFTFSDKIDCTQIIRTTGVGTPVTTGTGVEMLVVAGAGNLQAFNRTGSVYVQMNIEGNPLVLNSVAAQGVVISGATGGNKGNNTLNCNTYYGAGTAGVSAGSFSTITAITTVGGIVTQLTGASDARLKDVSGFYFAGLESIRQLRPVRYRWGARAAIGIGMDRTREYVGLLAQNLEDAMPDAVGREQWADESIWKTIDERRVLMAIINAIQELDRRQTVLEQTKAA